MAWTIESSASCLQLTGELTLADAPAIWRQLRRATRSAQRHLDVDMARASRVDGTIMALVVDLQTELHARGVSCEVTGLNDQLRRVMHLYQLDAPAGRSEPARGRPRPLAALGARAIASWARGRELAAFAGDVFAALPALLHKRTLAGWRSLPALLERAGADGLPIVILLDFLVGFVIAYQSTPELRMFGANVYIADVVGVSLTRELVPLMTAIIMAGRSGAAYAAELGTMRVSDEIDALRTMGFSPVSHLVLPRMAALAIVAPLLTLVGDVVGVAGGLIVAVRALDVSAQGYLTKLGGAVAAHDVWTGLLKSSAFALAISAIGCRQGLATRGSAAGVGRGTTTTVVHCLFAVVVIDTLFTIALREVGL